MYKALFTPDIKMCFDWSDRKQMKETPDRLHLVFYSISFVHFYPDFFKIRVYGLANVWDFLDLPI